VRLNINSVSCTNAATQYAGIAALEGPQDDVDRMCKAFDERRRVIVEETNTVPGFSSIEPAGAFYSMPNITATGISSKRMETLLLEELGVAAIAGTSFGRHGEGYIRFSYANSVDNIRKALARIRDYATAQRWDRAA